MVYEADTFYHDVFWQFDSDYLLVKIWDFLTAFGQ